MAESQCSPAAAREPGNPPTPHLSCPQAVLTPSVQPSAPDEHGRAAEGETEAAAANTAEPLSPASASQTMPAAAAVAAAAAAAASNTTDPRRSHLNRRPLGFLGLILLTISLTGVQFTWTVELAYGTPYLLSLGLAKSLTALVWIAGPLSGLLIQPIIGVYADRSTARLGRRRPFMLIGGFIVTLSVAAIAYAQEMARAFVGIVPNSSDRESAVRITAIIIAVVAFYFLDFSINAVQACCRALIVDVAPLHQQEVANAWGGRMIGVGNVLGYFIGYLDLPKWFPFLGNTQIKVLCVIAIAWFSFTLAVTCFAIHEKPYIATPSNKTRNWWRPLMDIILALGHLPRPIQSVCNVQFLAWLGWFPFLFYSSSWVSDKSDHGIGAVSKDAVASGASDEGTRAGSLALLWFAIISVVTGFVIPMVASRNGPHATGRTAAPSSSSNPSPYVSQTSNTLPISSIATIPETRSHRRSWKSYFSLPRVWAISLWAYAILMMCTIAVSEVAGAALIIALSGIPWGVMQWVPFTLMGECVRFYSGSGRQAAENSAASHSSAMIRSSESDDDADVDRQGASHRPGRQFPIYSRMPFGPTRHSGYASLSANEDDGSVVRGNVGVEQDRVVRNDRRAISNYDSTESDTFSEASSRHSGTQNTNHSSIFINNDCSHHIHSTTTTNAPILEAGMVIGIHNIYVVLPQFVSTLISAIVFVVIDMIQKAAHDQGGSEHDMDPFGWTLRLSAVASIWAGLLALRVEEIHGKSRA